MRVKNKNIINIYDNIPMGNNNYFFCSSSDKNFFISKHNYSGQWRCNHLLYTKEQVIKAIYEINPNVEIIFKVKKVKTF